VGIEGFYIKEMTRHKHTNTGDYQTRIEFSGENWKVMSLQAIEIFGQQKKTATTATFGLAMPIRWILGREKLYF